MMIGSFALGDLTNSVEMSVSREEEKERTLANEEEAEEARVSRELAGDTWTTARHGAVGEDQAERETKHAVR